MAYSKHSKTWAYLQFKYRTLDREIGHSAGIRDHHHLKELLDRYNLEPEDLYDITLDGKAVTPKTIARRLEDLEL